MIICQKCHRHVREARCPFCGSDNPDAPVLPGPSAHRIGMRRGALVVAVAAAAACGPDVVSAADAYGIPDSSHQDAITASDVYGIPQDAPPIDDVVAPDAAYGIPDSAPPQDVITASDAYGIPDGGIDGGSDMGGDR